MPERIRIRPINKTNKKTLRSGGHRKQSYFKQFNLRRRQITYRKLLFVRLPRYSRTKSQQHQFEEQLKLTFNQEISLATFLIDKVSLEFISIE